MAGESSLSAQITNLVGGATIDQEFCDDAAMNACKEIIPQLTSDLKSKCATKQTFTSAAAGSEAETLGEGGVLSVFAGSQSCRSIKNTDKYRASDSGSVFYATSADPVYYFEADKINVLPASLSCSYEEIQYPSVDVDAVNTIANFADEAEHLVILYASVRQLLKFQATMSASFNSDIGTAFTATNTELDETQVVCDKIDADLVLAKAEIVLAKAEAAEIASNTDNSSDFETACDAMVTELNKVDNAIVEASNIFDTVDEVIAEGSVEFDEAKNLSKAYNSGEIYDALGAIKTELDKADNIIDTAHTKVGNYYTDIAELDNADLWDDTNKRFDEVKLSLENAMSLIGFSTAGDKYDAGNDLEAIMGDIEAQLNSEDTELAGGRMSQAQTQMNAVSTHLSTAQTQMTEIGILIQKHSLPLAGVPQYISTASGYISQAQGYVAQVSAYTTMMQAFIGTGNAYLQEANAIANQGKAYLSEAQAYMSQAGGYASEVGARSTFVSAKSQAVQGHISTAQGYVSSATGFGSEVQTKIAIANGYIAEAGSRLQADNAKYQWYGDQYAKLSAEYNRGLAALKGGSE